MNAILWTIVAMGAVNTAAIIITAFVGDVPPAGRWHRAIDALITLAMACWALWLLAKGAA